jgi:hypothetical protein
MSSTWPLPLQPFDPNFVCTYYHSSALYIPRPSHAPWFNHPNIQWRLQIMKLSLCNFLQPFIISCLFDRNASVNTLFRPLIKLTVPLLVRWYITLSKTFQKKIEYECHAFSHTKHGLDMKRGAYEWTPDELPPATLPCIQCRLSETSWH